MATQIPEGYALVSHHFVNGSAGDGAITTYGIDVQGSALDPQGIAEALYTIFNTNIVVAMLAGSMLHERVVLKLGPTDTGPQYEFSGEGQSGSEAGAPPNVAYLAAKNTGLGGRRGRGRMFLPGVAEASVDNGGNVSGSYVTNSNGNLSAFLGALNAADLPMVLLHDEGGPAPTDVVNMVLRPKVATQRRRLR